MINKELAEKQQLIPDTITAIEVLQTQLKAFLARPTMYVEGKDVARIVEGMEYTLQFLWGFPVDRNFHRYWYDVKGCVCPKLDNKDRFGTPYRVINPQCPFHGEQHD
jgi:hypothetical protein